MAKSMINYLVIITSTIISLISIILIYVYDKNINYLLEVTDDLSENKFQTTLKRLILLKDLLDNVLNLIVILVFIYNLIYMIIYIIVTSERFEEKMQMNGIATQSNETYSNLALEIFFGILIKVLALSLGLYFISMSLNEFTLMQTKEEFYNLSE